MNRPVLRVLDTLCHNELARAMGYGPKGANRCQLLAAPVRAVFRYWGAQSRQESGPEGGLNLFGVSGAGPAVISEPMR